MSDDAPQLDLQLQWDDETETRRQTSLDSVAVASEAARGETSQNREAPVASAEGLEPERAEAVKEDEDDAFEWTEEREAALEAALDEAGLLGVPRVQQQLSGLATALEQDQLDPERALELLDEVSDYLADRLQREQRKRPVDNELFTRSRADKVNGLFAYQEAAGALREYVDSADPLQLKVARYALRQGESFLDSASELIMACEPDETENSLEA